nr:DUF4150 domain-containing protein [Methylobacterium ajmalii]
MTSNETVKINDLTLCHKHSAIGFVRATLPDVCRSPVAPVPYANVAYARDLENGTVTVRSHGGAMNGVKGSRFYPSYDDEPGTGGGVTSGVNRHEATWLSWSPNVFMEGRPVTRLTDKMLMNRGNTVSVGEYQTRKPVGKEVYICEIACPCYVKNKNFCASNRYSICFTKDVRSRYPEVVAGDPGSGTGLASEIGFWDPLNPKNLPGSTTPPGGIIGPNKLFPFWRNSGSRWIDAIYIQDGQMTDMWDIKFGDDGPNGPAKDLSYRAIANKYGSNYNGEFRFPKQCDDCNQEEDKKIGTDCRCSRKTAKIRSDRPRAPSGSEMAAYSGPSRHPTTSIIEKLS